MFDYSKDTAVEDTGVINYFFVQALVLSASSMNKVFLVPSCSLAFLALR